MVLGHTVKVAGIGLNIWVRDRSITIWVMLLYPSMEGEEGHGVGPSIFRLVRSVSRSILFSACSTSCVSCANDNDICRNDNKVIRNLLLIIVQFTQLNCMIPIVVLN